MIAIKYSSLFKKKVKLLDQKTKKTLKAKLELMLENPKHPSLRTKKIQGTEGIFEASINMSVRMTFEYDAEGNLILRNIGEHDKTLSNP